MQKLASIPGKGLQGTGVLPGELSSAGHLQCYPRVEFVPTSSTTPPKKLSKTFGPADLMTVAVDRRRLQRGGNQKAFAPIRDGSIVNPLKTGGVHLIALREGVRGVDQSPRLRCARVRKIEAWE